MDRFSACSLEDTPPRQSRLARGSGETRITRPRADPTRGHLTRSGDPRARRTRRLRPALADENSFTYLDGHASTAHGRAEAQRRAHRSLGNDVSRCRARDADGAREFFHPRVSRFLFFALQYVSSVRCMRLHWRGSEIPYSRAFRGMTRVRRIFATTATTSRVDRPLRLFRRRSRALARRNDQRGRRTRRPLHPAQVLVDEPHHDGHGQGVGAA